MTWIISCWRIIVLYIHCLEEENLWGTMRQHHSGDRLEDLKQLYATSGYTVIVRESTCAKWHIESTSVFTRWNSRYRHRFCAALWNRTVIQLWCSHLCWAVEFLTRPHSLHLYIRTLWSGSSRCHYPWVSLLPLCSRWSDWPWESITTVSSIDTISSIGSILTLLQH